MIASIIVPTIESIAAEAERRIELDVAVFCADSEALPLGLIAGGDHTLPTVRGQMRLRFREAFQGRLLVYGETILERSEAAGSFSGFTVKGESAPSAKPRSKGVTVRHNVWSWKGWV